MAAPGVPRGLAVAAGVMVWAALALQLALSLQLTYDQGRGTVDGLVTFLSFFTILTNLLVALTLTAPTLALGTAVGRLFAMSEVATGVAVAITMVGGAYVTLLRHVWDPQGAQLVADVALHYFTPVIFVLYWWLAIPKSGLRWSAVPWMLLYPLTYLGYTIVRGALSGDYAYYFLDAVALGYRRFAVNALGLSALFVVIATLYTWLGRLQARGSRA